MEKKMDREFGTILAVWGGLCIWGACNAFDMAEVLSDGTLAKVVGVVEGSVGVGAIGYGGYVFFRKAQ